MNGLPDHLNFSLSLWWCFLGNGTFIKTILDYSKGLEKLSSEGMNKREEASQLLFLGIRDSSPPSPLPGSAEAGNHGCSWGSLRKAECGHKHSGPLRRGQQEYSLWPLTMKSCSSQSPVQVWCPDSSRQSKKRHFDFF